MLGWRYLGGELHYWGREEAALTATRAFIQRVSGTIWGVTCVCTYDHTMSNYVHYSMSGFHPMGGRGGGRGDRGKLLSPNLQFPPKNLTLIKLNH